MKIYPNITDLIMNIYEFVCTKREYVDQIRQKTFASVPFDI